MSAKQQASQAVFGSVYGKHKSNSDAQIGREIARLNAQQLNRPRSAFDNTTNRPDSADEN